MTDSRAIVHLLVPLYEAIAAREAELGLHFGGGDMRVRVERFHDAVREFTQGHTVPVEELSYCLQAIHYLTHKPLAHLAKPSHSASTQVIKKTAKELTAQRAANREDKQFLSDAYQRYGVLFSALFATQADRDMRDRVEELDEQVSQLAEIEAVLTQMAQGKAAASNLAAAAHGVSDEALKTVLATLKKTGKATPELIQKAMKQVKESMRGIDSAIDEIETAHLNFAASQLALFEAGKTLVKQLAASGLNLAGQFVNQAVQQDNSRGRGR